MALTFAAMHGRIEIIKFLIENKVDVNTRDDVH
jgi:ankyrin repeat protein